ncbi:transposase [Actinoplanes awajinensis]|uniref:transposase n=1 Tax=Actinoplanes awajinensis TaxID=135946 RepID=UPI0009FC11D3|nr:transposase [Actinoplanes awajinensis]
MCPCEIGGGPKRDPLPRAKKTPPREYREEAVKLVIETSRLIVQVAKELGIQEGTRGSWVARYRREQVSDEPGLTVTERARIRQLERETRDLRMENEFLKSSRVLHQGSSVSDTPELIDAEGADKTSLRNDGVRKYYCDMWLAAGLSFRIL